MQNPLSDVFRACFYKVMIMQGVVRCDVGNAGTQMGGGRHVDVAVLQHNLSSF